MSNIIGTQVYIAIYTHKHGTDVDVYMSEHGAYEWLDSIIEEYWLEEVGHDENDQPIPMPEEGWQRRKMYFEASEENFEIILASIKS